MHSRLPLLSLLPLLLLGLASPAPGESPDSLDYRAQGEYQGRVRDWQDYTGRLGLQVVALGDGQFQGVVYRDGLPADGWDRRQRWTFTGGVQHGGLALRHDASGSRLEFVDQGLGFWKLLDARGRWVSGLVGVERHSPTLGRAAPADATVVFDGTLLKGLEGAKINERGNLQVGFQTEMPVQDFELHVEFRTPFEPTQRGQGRGNSGVYIQRRYEVQILDSFGLEGVANECSGLYRQRAPEINMCFPPLVWQTYDIIFRAARFDAEGHKTEPARITVWHNGRIVHNDVEIVTKTGAGKPEGPEPLPILFQDHSNPVEYRNLWIVTHSAD